MKKDEWERPIRKINAIDIIAKEFFGNAKNKN